MPLHEDEKLRRYFYPTKAMDETGVMKGKLATGSTERDPKAVKIDRGEGKVSYRRYYGSISGVLLGISTRERESEKGKYHQWELEIDGGGGEIYILSFNIKSASSNSIMHRLPNCDLKEPIMFSPIYFKDKDRILTLVRQKEDGKWVNVEKLWKYDEKAGKMTNGMPDMVVTEKPVTGEKQYDDTDQMKFMWAYFKENILPVLAENKEGFEQTAELPPEQPQHEEIPEEDAPPPTAEDEPVTEDDLPF